MRVSKLSALTGLCGLSWGSPLDTLWWESIEIIADFLEVFPGFTFLRRIAKQVSGMKGRHNFDPAKISELTTYTTDAFTHLQKISQRSIPHDNDYVRLDSSNFPKQKRTANRRLFKRRLTISWRTAPIYVSNDYVHALHPHRFNHPGYQLTGASHERFSLRVSIGAV